MRWGRLAYVISWLKRQVGISAVVVFVGASISALSSVSGMPAAVVVFGALVAAGGALWSSGERAQFEGELREKSDEIARLNREIMHSVTGGDSFCYLQFVSLGVSEPNTAILTLMHRGKYPSYEVGGYMVDLQESRRTPDGEQVIPGGAFHNIQGAT